MPLGQSFHEEFQLKINILTKFHQDDVKAIRLTNILQSRFLSDPIKLICSHNALINHIKQSAKLHHPEQSPAGDEPSTRPEASSRICCDVAVIKCGRLSARKKLARIQFI